MNFKQFVRDYFTFSRNERKGIIALLLIIFMLAVANKFIFYFEKPGKIDEAFLDSARHELAVFNDSINQDSEKQSPERSTLEERQPGTSSAKPSADESGLTKNVSAQLFHFDPNKCTDEDFRQLGFSGKQTEAIRKYIATGAVFKSKDDFFKIRVITEKQKQALASWIVIPEPVKDLAAEKGTEKAALIDINSADSLHLEQLPGIGKVLSKRIIKYRDLLGGFYTIDQLNEVYGLDESTISRIAKSIKIDQSEIRKLDLNFADRGDLSRHPYIKKEMAARIIKFRSKHGSIDNLVILRDSLKLSPEEFARLKPYFSEN